MKIPPLLAASAVLNLGLAVWVASLVGPSSPPLVAGSTPTPIAGRPLSPSRASSLPPPADFRSAPIVPAPSAAHPANFPVASAPASPPPFSFPRERSPATATASLAPESSLPEETAADPTLGRRQVVNSAAPGNSLHFRGVRVALAETYQPSGSGDRSLGVDVSPASPAARGEGTLTPDGSSTEVGIPSGTRPDGDSANPSGSTGSGAATTATQAESVASESADADGKDDGFGFTREEELFRMKWGWAAYDAVRAEARREAGRIPR